MTEEGEMESIAPGALNTGSETGTLVEVKFEKNPYQTQKYLEAEPKALGVTQIMLGLFVMSIECSIPIHDSFDIIITNTVSSSAGIIAGSVAIAAQNLHLPKLKACLGMQVVACVVSVISLLNILGEMGNYPPFNPCWEGQHTDMCQSILSISEHITGIVMLVHLTQFALAATLAAFCCKVVQCCSPRSNVPVVVVNAPQDPQ